MNHASISDQEIICLRSLKSKLFQRCEPRHWKWMAISRFLAESLSRAGIYASCYIES
jgi:hypothetical protein